MTVNTVEQFKANLAPTRSNNFEFVVLPPAFLVQEAKTFDSFIWHVRTANLLGDTIEEIDIPYGGTSVYIAGDKTYDTLTTTFQNTQDFKIRKMLTKWREYIKSDSVGISADTQLYKTIGYLYQKNGNGGIIYTQAMVGLWPTVVGELTNDMGSKSTMQTFDVTWRYDYLLPEI